MRRSQLSLPTTTQPAGQLVTERTSLRRGRGVVLLLSKSASLPPVRYHY